MMKPADHQNHRSATGRAVPADVRRLVDFLDTRMQGPLGFRFGWDGIIGLIPGIGDLVTSSMSTYVIFRAAGLGAPPILLLRMAGNVLFENLVDLIPFVGNIFDFFWKANVRNLRLLEDFLAKPKASHLGARIWVVMTLALILAVLVGMIAISFMILRAVWQFLTQDQTGPWTY